MVDLADKLQSESLAPFCAQWTYPGEVASVVGGAVGLVTTILRLFFRRRRLWWDDAFALVSMLFLILHVGALFIFVLNEPGIYRR
jgi:hypothetical protein